MGTLLAFVTPHSLRLFLLMLMSQGRQCVASRPLHTDSVQFYSWICSIYLVGEAHTDASVREGWGNGTQGWKCLHYKESWLVSPTAVDFAALKQSRVTSRFAFFPTPLTISVIKFYQTSSQWEVLSDSVNNLNFWYCEFLYFPILIRMLNGRLAES